MDTDAVIDGLAKELGASEAARKKWRQRGVPYRWREEIRERAAVLGIAIARESFDEFGRRASEAA